MNLPTLEPKQAETVNDFNSYVKGFIGGLGSGKTFTNCVNAIIYAVLNPGKYGLMVSPTYRMLQDTILRTFTEICDEHNIKYRYKENKSYIYLPGCGSTILLRSGDDPEKLHGPNIAWATMDEASFMSKAAFDAVIGRVRDKKSNFRQILITGTPNGYDHLYEYFQEQKPTTPRKLVTVSTVENAKHLSEEYIPTIMSSYSEKMVEQYIHGRFVNIKSGRVYYAYEPGANIRTAAYDPELALNIAVDFNVNPMCWAVIQSYGDVDCVIDEVIGYDTNTTQQTLELMKRYPDHRQQISIYGDYSGTFRHTSSQSTDYDIITQLIPHAQLYTKPNPNIIDRVNAVNARLCNARGERKLFIARHCTMAQKDFDQVSWVEGKREIDKRDPQRTHISDAIGYYVEYQHSLRSRPQVTHSYRRAS